VMLGAASATVVPSFAQPGPAPATLPAQAQGLPTFADIVDRVKPAVVSVRVKRAEAASDTQGGGVLPPNWREFGLPDDGGPFGEFFRRFRERDGDPRGMRPSPRRQAQGSGFFISADGYLVTNNHVIEKSSEVEVLLEDGRTLDAKVVGTDPKTDLALLKVEGANFPFVELASGAPRVGDWVLAVGNPFGLGGTVTAGIVSARGRDIGAGPYDDFIQIDAPVNRGNSGGPAFNLSGQVVGVNTAISSPSGGNVGIAFAIPSETVSRIVRQIRETGTVSRGFLGVQIQPVNEDIAKSVGLDKAEGAIVGRVEENSPAAKAGLKTGDVVLSVDGKPLKDARELSRTIAWMEPGAKATLQVWRDGARQEITVTLGRQPANQSAEARDDNQPAAMGKLGLQLAPADRVAGTDRAGVAVTAVQPGSPAAERGFRTGDVIAEVGGKPVTRPEDVANAIETARKDGKAAVLFRVEARNGSRFIAVPVPAA
jgi:serine protease Do